MNRSVLEQISHSLNFGAAGRIAELFAEREREFSALKILTPDFSTRFGGLGKLVIDDTTRAALEAAGKALHDRFRYPELEELHRKNSQIAAAISALQPTTNLARIVEALGSIRGPWIDSLSSQASIASFANLTSIAEHVRVAPFQPDLSEALGKIVGAWTSIPEDCSTIRWDGKISI